MPPVGRPPRRVPGSSELKGCLFAIALAATSVACRAALQTIAPAVGPYVLLFPAIVMAGIFWGTPPAVLAACFGGLVTCMIGIVPRPFAPPQLSAANIDAFLYLPASAAMIWATATLRQSRQMAENAQLRLAEVFRQFPGAATVLEGPSGKFLLNSEHSEKVLGHDAKLTGEQVVDMGQYGGIHEDGTPYRADEYPIVRAYTHGEIIQAESLRYLRADGGVVDLEVYAGPIRAPDGRIVAAVGTALDVSKRVEAERRLRASEVAHRTAAERLRAAMDAGGLGVWEVDLATDRIWVDEVIAMMLGRHPHAMEMPRNEFRTLIHEEDCDSVQSNLEAAIAAGGTYAEQCRVLTAQGGVRWVLSHGTVLHDIQKIVGVMADITEQREREKALRDALAARNILMHEADHRIKNSLQLVISLLGLQMAKAPDAGTKTVLADAIARVNAIASAHRALESSPDLKSIGIDGMLDDLCGRLGTLNPAVSLYCQATTGVQLDAEQAIPLGLLASEVLTNALRHAFTPGEHGQVSVTSRREDANLEMTIADNGRGLPTENARTGLGTSVIAALARQIGATVTTTSRPGEGVSVAVRVALPCLEAAERVESLSAD